MTVRDGLRLSGLRRWLGEPLVHFVVVGSLLYLASRATQPTPDEAERATRIVITADDVRQIGVAWSAQGRLPPTEEQMRSLVEAKVWEEVLYREAIALGLDRDDTIVRRRLAQKMEFLFEDVAALRDPKVEELRAWFDERSHDFVRASRATFRHLYFSPDRRGSRAGDDSRRALGQLDGRAADAATDAELGDAFMFQSYYADQPFDEVARTFGASFAKALFDLAPGGWRGPIESGYGWHVIWVEAITPARVPAFEEVEADVRQRWIDERRAEVRRQAFEALRARYEIVLPASDAYRDGGREIADARLPRPAGAEVRR